MRKTDILSRGKPCYHPVATSNVLYNTFRGFPLSVAETGAQPRDARTVAEDSIRRWEELRSQLAPVIGDNGFRVLFARSLHKSRYAFPWLAREAKHSESPFAGLKDSLQDQTSVLAEEANRELLAAFGALLNDFIGKPLATRLLTPSTSPGTAR